MSLVCISSVRKSKASQFFAAAVSVAVLTAGVVGCQKAPSADTLATVNSKPIMQVDLDRAYKQNLGEPAQPPSKEEVAIQRLNLLKNLITEEILQQRAAKLNLIATDEEVDSKLHDMKALATDEEFNRQLKEKNLTIDDLKRDIRRELTKTKLINKEIESKINITESEISNYYSGHKSEFNLIEPQYHLEQIVVTNKPSKQVTNLQNSKASTDEEAKKKMQQLKGRLDTGEDFASVAQRYSEDPATSSNGGDLGFIQETSLQSDPDAFAAVGKLKAGQLTDVLTVYSGEGANRKALGYVIYRLVEKQPAGQWEMNDPRAQFRIRQLLHNNHAQLLQNAYIEMLYNDTKIHNYLAEEIVKNGAQ